MTTPQIVHAPHPFPADLLGRMVALYNRSMATVHGFFPMTAELFRRRVLDFPMYRPEWLFLAMEGAEPVGMLHAAVMRHPAYEPAGTVEMVCVDPAWRGQGIAGRLLDTALERFRHERGLFYIDGGGAFPNTPFYSTLLNGSERSGIELAHAETVGLFRSRGFAPYRESIVMRADLTEELPPLALRFNALLAGADRDEHVRETEATWFDLVFRGWKLTESSLYTATRREPVTRAVYVPMEDLSRHEGRRLYGVFAVQTLPEERGRGWATAHFHLLRRIVRSLGGECLELHVYADNAPAVRLYTNVGFKPQKRTCMFRRAPGA